ncbi:hypothetical protein [Streptomyces collinus]|uniref:hypothetical protein n=1 Tax=Streptomyces collinus TaxID=42684 RepID=UPI0037D51B55
MSWSGRLAALALAVCAVVHFPLQRGDASLRLHAFALGLSVLCTCRHCCWPCAPWHWCRPGRCWCPRCRPGPRRTGVPSRRRSCPGPLDLALAPAWLAASVAGCAALLSLVALVFRVPAPIAARQWAAEPASEARCMTE